MSFDRNNVICRLGVKILQDEINDLEMFKDSKYSELINLLDTLWVTQKIQGKYCGAVWAMFNKNTSNESAGWNVFLDNIKFNLFVDEKDISEMILIFYNDSLAAEKIHEILEIENMQHKVSSSYIQTQLITSFSISITNLEKDFLNKIINLADIYLNSNG